MSFAALAWAATQRPGNLAAKMVLLGLANFADEHGCAYPSTAALAEFGDMDHKTATAALDRLVELRLIADSGERAGRTKQIKVYRLNIESQPETEAYQKRKPSVSSVKDPQKRGTDTVKEPEPKKAKASLGKRASKSGFILPAHIPPVAWDAFVEMRNRTGKRMTDYAKSLAVGRLDKLAEDGWPPGDVLNHSTLNNYQGLFPPKDRSNGYRPDPLTAALEAARAAEDQDNDPGAWSALPA